ncbi:MAG: hypothetical protein NTX87_18790 [Planctomycetota bacterium]|nr:hypothetical protein [Planctomycetota bacterium]
MKRKLIIIVPAVAVLLAAGIALFLLYGMGSGTVQRWIAGQLETVAGSYLNPRLSLGALRYEYPLTAVVDDVRLVADDPAKPGATVDIFVARRVTLEMAEIPRPGQPLRIRKMILDHPEFRAVGVSEKDSSLVGYSHFLKGPAQPEVKLTDVFEIRQIQILDGLVVYDPRTPGARPMEIDQVSFILGAEPVKGSEAGWYAMEMNLDRKPLFSTHFAGRVNLDTQVADVKQVRVELKLGRDQDHYLPPEVQGILKDHEVSGNLVVEASGPVHASDWRASTLKAQVTLAGGNFAAGEHHIPIDRLQVLWTMADRRGTLETLDAGLLAGRLEARGEVALNGPLDGQFEMHLTDIRLEQGLRNAAGGEGKYRGDISGDITWKGPLTDALKQSQGGGTIRIVDGDLAHVPVLSALISVATRAMNAAGMGSGPPRDTADMAFTFEGNRMNFNKVLVMTRMAALHGHGDIYFDTRLDMIFNAGAVEKIESMLGRFGAFLGSMSDEVSAYTLTGTLAEPDVGVKMAPNLW